MKYVSLIIFIVEPVKEQVNSLFSKLMLEAGTKDNGKDLSDLDMDQTVIARRLGKSISKTAVVSMYQKWSKEGTVMNQWQGHGSLRLIDAHAE